MWIRGGTLGRGRFGFVSLAILDPKTDNLGFNLPSVIALKSARVSCSRSLQKERKLLSEFEDCPHILRCYGADVSEEDGVQLYNIMLEYASGGSLADRIRSSTTSSKGMSQDEVRQYTKSILKGLSHIHERRYVHCDIKPQNILLVGASSSSSSPPSPSIRGRKRVDGTAKIADFGLGKKAGKKPKGLRGTPLYVAPESVLYQEYEAQCDIWALGCTVLEMITGKPAWKCDPNTKTRALLHRIGFTKQVPDIPSGLSKEAKDFLKKCLVRDPKLRWTADMLLSHPFVSSMDIVTVTKGIKEEGNTTGDSSTSTELDLFIKPNLLWNSPSRSSGLNLKPNLKLVRDNNALDWSFSDHWVVMKPASTIPNSRESHGCPVCKKRKRMAEEVHDHEVPE